MTYIHICCTQIVESEMVAENSRSRCEEQHIPFYRFSATLDDIVAAGETDNDKLFNMVLKTKMQTPEQGLDSLVEMFHLVAEISKRIGDSIKEEGELQNESLSAPQEHVHVSPEAMFAIGEVVDVHETKAEGVKEGYQPLETEDQDSQQNDPQLSEITEGQIPLPSQLNDPSPLKPNMNEESNLTTLQEAENHFISEVKKEDPIAQLPPDMKGHQTPLLSGKQDDTTASTHSELYKSYKLATQEPITEEESRQQLRTAYRLETLV